MQEVFEKIIKTLKAKAIEELGISERQFAIDEGEYSSYCSLTLYDVQEIVKQTTAEYNNGWIPVSARLPKENGYYYVTQIVKSISTGKKIAIEKSYVEFSEGEWRRAKHFEVIAWLDIEPYQPKGDQL